MGEHILKKEEVSLTCKKKRFLKKNHRIQFLMYHHVSISTFIIFLPPPLAVDAQLDEVGLSFVKNSISAIETRGKNS